MKVSSLRSFFFAAGLVASVASCSFSLADKTAPYVNNCQSAGECGVDGICIAQKCVSTKADLAQLYLEISVPSSSPVAPATAYVRKAADLGLTLQGSDASGFQRNLDLVIADLVNTTSSFSVKVIPAGCEKALGANGSVPHNVDLYPTGQPTGIALTTYTDIPAVPAGIYDIYLRPKIADPSCLIPPALFRQQDLHGNSASISFVNQQPAQLTGHLDVDLTGCGDTSKPETCWHLQLVDNDSGRLISTDAKFLPDGKASSFVLSYWPPNPKDAKPVDPVLVLTPPDAQRKQGMPVPFWKLVAIDPDGDNNVSLEIATLTSAAAKPIPVEASVLSGNVPVPSTVILRSKQLLDGQFGGNAVFETTTQTDADGKFAVNLVAGKYDIVAIPAAASGFAVTIDTWTFLSGDLGKGRTFQVHTLSRIKATALTPRGEPAAGIPVLMTPSRGQNDTLLKLQVQGDLLDSLARSATTTTDGLGAFALDVDPGRVDLSLRPPAASNLPWLTRPQIDVPSSMPQTVPLHELAFTNPVVLAGSVRSSKGSLLAGVSVRAWLAVTQPGSTDAHPTAVPIGEATSDGNGHYRLLLPASVLQ